TARSTAAASSRSASTTRVFSLSCRSRRARSTSTRLAPRRPNSAATARPRFPDAPVIITVWPAKSIVPPASSPVLHYHSTSERVWRRGVLDGDLEECGFLGLEHQLL